MVTSFFADLAARHGFTGEQARERLARRLPTDLAEPIARWHRHLCQYIWTCIHSPGIVLINAVPLLTKHMRINAAKRTQRGSWLRCAQGSPNRSGKDGGDMFVSDKIVFIELQKTGCTHIRNQLKELLGGEFVERHIQADPRLFTGNRYFLGSIRDPWNWHVSLWAYCCDGKGDFLSNVATTGIRIRDRGWRIRPYSLFIELLGSRPNWHAKQWKRTFRDVNDAGAFRQWLYMLHDETYWADVGEGYWRCAMNRFAGLLTYRYMKLFTCKKGELGGLRTISTPEQLAEHERKNCFIDHFIRNESLESDLLAALKLTQIEIPRNATAEMMSRPRTNTSSKRHGSRYYYDTETEKLVGDRESIIIEKFGYVAPSAKQPYPSAG